MTDAGSNLHKINTNSRKNHAILSRYCYDCHFESILLRLVAKHIAIAVARTAIDEGLAHQNQEADLEKLIQDRF